MKKSFNLALVAVVAFFVALSSPSALTKYEFAGWVGGEGYGSATKVDDIITTLKGESTQTGGMYFGPYSKASTAKLSDGIVEEFYIEIDPEKVANGEYFEVSLALNNGEKEYVSESVITSQKYGEVVNVSVKGAPDFEGVITTKGIYTYQWKMYVEGSNTYVEFTLLQGNNKLATSGKIDMDVALKTNETKNPIAEQEDVSVRSLWFCNINVAEGLNVYSELPVVSLTFANEELEYSKTVDVFKYTYLTEEELESIIEDLTSELKDKGYTFEGIFEDEDFENEYNREISLEDDKVVYVNASKIVENPKTGDNIISYLIIGSLSLISLAGCSLYLNRKRFN